jgi:hypothetical protein
MARTTVSAGEIHGVGVRCSGYEGAIDCRQQHPPLLLGIHRVSSEIRAETEVGKQSGGILVKMKE